MVGAVELARTADAVTAAAPALRWTLAHGVQAAFSTRADGSMYDPDARARWLHSLGIRQPCAVAKQVHGARVLDGRAWLAAAEKGEDVAARSGDALVSDDAELALGVFGADCPGVVLVAPDALAVAHCGWRGAAAGIIAGTVAALTARSRHAPDTWHALIGPGISGPEYEVDAPVLSARPWPASALVPSERAEHAQLDLAAALDHDLRAQGVTRITRSDVCTAHDGRLHSFRHHGRQPGLGFVQVLVAWR